MTERIIEGRWSAEKCPRCGATLLTNDQGDLWCSFIGGAGRAACAFGLVGKDVPAEQEPPVDWRRRALAAEATLARGERPPIPMILFCPKCGLQHIDAPDPERAWTNPPHRSHMCHHCGRVWRPADVPTEGVLAIETRGQDDGPLICGVMAFDSDRLPVIKTWNREMESARARLAEVSRG